MKAWFSEFCLVPSQSFMKVFGIDFTSTPTTRKPITCVGGGFKKSGFLTLDRLETFPVFSDFDEFLKRKGPWLTGMDFPLGLPLKFINQLKLNTEWSSYVRTIGNWEKNRFESEIISFKNKRPKGQKEPLRITDALTGAKSPLKLINPSVGKMFYKGAPRLLRSGVSIIPCRPKKDNRIIFESYPALLARKFTKKYKNENSGSLFLIKARENIIKGITSTKTARQMGFSIRINYNLKAQSLEDAKGDILDAILCAVQATWAYSQEKNNYGIPDLGNESLASEGWIVNPFLNIQ